MVAKSATARPSIVQKKSDQELLMSAAASQVISKAVRASSVISANVADVAGTISGLFQSYAPLAYNLPWETLDYIELLATYNPDYSQAVDNIRTLANSGHRLYVDAGSDLQKRRMKERLENLARTTQDQHGGIDGVIDKLLDQAATYGAMAGEWIVNESMDQVIDFVDVNPKSIRFFFDETLQKWAAFQRVSMKQAQEARKQGREVRNNSYVRLNDQTFRYYAFDAAPGSPYGVPPFLSALQPISVQRDLTISMSQIAKKIGLLGIIDMTIKNLPRVGGETDAQYVARASSYLDQYITVVEDMVKDGGIVHFEDVDITTTQLAGNAAGATNIWKQNEEQVFSGLKSMPSVQGRSYSTTETYAGVAYDIIIRNTLKYQRAVKRMIEFGYWLDLTLGGMIPKGIEIKFKTNKTLQRLQQAQAEDAEIKNAHAKWVMGIIDQLTAAQELGYDEVKTPMEDPPELGGGSVADAGQGNDLTDSSTIGDTGRGRGQ